MDISLPGNPRAMTALAGAAEALPAAEGAPVQETPPQEKPNLVVTETPAPPGAGGIPPAELEKAMVRDDALGKFVDKALADIDNMKPSEREIEMRKESLKREAQKADERRAEELAAEQLRAQLAGGLLPGEKALVKDELDRVVVRV